MSNYKKTKPEIERVVWVQAINTLMSIYGREMRNCILDRKVKLTKTQVIQVALMAEAYPDETEYFGEIIRAGNTRLLRELMGFKTRGRPTHLTED